MKTKASFAGEPIHPMLVHYPIALWTTSVVTDVVFYFTRNISLVLISKFLIAAGILGALAAAIPGFIDWLTITDPVAKKTGLMHMVLNLTALLLFGLSLYLRMRNYGAPAVGHRLQVPFIVSLAGLIDLGVAASLGGKLVYKHRMGVDEGGGKPDSV